MNVRRYAIPGPAAIAFVILLFPAFQPALHADLPLEEVEEISEASGLPVDQIERFINARSAGSLNDFRKAVDQVRARARKGDALSRFLLALHSGQDIYCTLPGYEVKRYLADGLPAVKKLEKGGNPLAFYLLGLERLYIHKDVAGGMEWLKRAAEEDLSLAQNTLGLIYYLGNGCERDCYRAGLYFRRAAASGDMNAEYNLGTLYAEGKGVPRDPGMARRL